MSTSPNIPALGAGLPENRPAPVKLASERVTIAAPMSLAGSTARTRNVIERISGVTAKKVSLVTGLTLVLVMWWLLILWFGLWLVPYRLFRRGQRKRDVAMLRHREFLASMASRPPDDSARHRQ